MNTINCRAALAGALTLPAASIAEPAKASGNLAAIGLELDAAIAADRTAWLAASDAEEAADAEDKRLRPLALRIRPADAALGVCGANDRREAYSETDVIFLRDHFAREGITKATMGQDGSVRVDRIDPSPEALARAREIALAWHAWRAAIAAAGKRAAADRASARAKAASDAVSAIVARIASLRATTGCDLAVKVKAMAWALGVDPEEVAGEVASYDRLAGPILASIIADSGALSA